MSFTKEDEERLVHLAMEQAEESIKLGNSPFGAVLVDPQGKIVATAYNTGRSSNDPTAHAEINLIRQVCKTDGRRRLAGCALFINAASCTMCAAALIHNDVRDFYYGAPLEPDASPMLTYEELARYCPEPIRVRGGILADECRTQIERGRRG